jgi:hypothetical protein
MKDGNPTILYTKETREVCNLLCIHRAYRAAEQQSNRALRRSRDTSHCCLGRAVATNVVANRPSA